MRIDELAEGEREGFFDAVAAAGPLVGEIRRLTAGGGPCLAVDFSERFMLNSAGFGDVWRCATVLEMDLIASAAQGRGAEAAADVVSMVELAAILEEDPQLHAQLDRHRAVIWLYKALAAHCPLEIFSDPDLGGLIDTLADAEGRQGVVNGLLGEQYLGATGFDALVHSGWGGRAEWVDTMRMRGERDIFWPAFYGYLSPVLRPHHNNQMAAHIRLFGRAAEVAALPYFEGKAAWDALRSDYAASPPGLLRLAHERFVAVIGINQAAHETRIHLMRLALCLERYRREHGVYPEALAALAPGLPGGLPVDPFCGAAYHYVREEGGDFVLYGVGENLVDDCGDLEKDWCWRGGGGAGQG